MAETIDEDIEPSTFLGEVVPLYQGDSNTMFRATVIDGYNVYQRYNDGTNSVAFDNEVPKGTNIEYMYVQINFPTGVPRDTLFDLTVRFTHSKATGFEPLAMTLYDESTQSTKSIKSNLTYNHQNGETVLTFKDIKANFIADRCILRYSYSGYSTSAAFVHNVASVNLAEVSNTSLISGIISAITNLPELIADAFGSLFDIVVEGLDYVMQAVYDMGDLIVGGLIDLKDMLLDGIKSLFVPTEEDITEIKQSWDTLLRIRFGGLYEVIGLLDDYGSTFKELGDNVTESIYLPAISIPLGGSEFVFGGYDVVINPHGFIEIFQIKTITSIISVCLFVNGMRKRFEKVVESE